MFHAGLSFFFSSQTTTFLFFFLLLHLVIFFYAAPSLHPPTSKLTTSQLTGMLSKNLLFSLYWHADLFVTRGGKAEPKRAGLTQIGGSLCGRH